MKRIRRKTIYGYHFKKTNSKYEKYLKWKSIYEFDKKGQLRRNHFFWRTSIGKNMVLSARNYYKYDDNGRLILRKSFDPKDRLRQRNIYCCDKDGRKTKMESALYDETGKCNEKMTVSYKYDKADNLMRMKVLNGQHGYEEYIYTYDENNRIISEKVRSSEYNNYDCVYEYSKSMVIKKYSSGMIGVTSHNGEEIYKSYASNGTLNDMIISRYDKFGNIIYKKSTYFHCNCTGVYKHPRDLEIIKYKYYR